jgi:hypothetical protein
MNDQPTPFRALSSGFSALDHIARARQYRRAAMKVEDIEFAEPCWPKYFLMGHAIELALKAVPEFFNPAIDYKAPTAMAAPGNHDLVGLYEWAKLHGLAADELIDNNLPSLSELHEDYYARYPQGLKPVRLASSYDDLVDKIIENVERLLRVRP